MLPFLFLLLLLLNVFAVTCFHPPASFSISPDSSFQVLLNNEPFLQSGSFRITNNAENLPLEPSSQQITNEGYDTWGAYNSTTINFEFEETTWLQVSLLAYEEFVVIQTTLPLGLKNTAAAVSSQPPMDGDLSNVLLSFQKASTEKYNFLTWNSDNEFSYETGSNGLTGACDLNQCSEYSGLPMVLHDSSSKTSAVISPVNNFKDLEVSSNGDEWSVGLRRTIENVSPGFSSSFIIVPGSGSPRKNMNTWGQLMRSRYGRKLHDPSKSIDSEYLGYWTDNGATYYYHTDNNSTTEETFQALKDYHVESGLSKLFKYYHFDSWFYPKDSQTGMLEWDANTTLLPSGLPNLVYNILETSAIVAHSRWFSPNSTYVTDQLEFNWVLDHKDHVDDEVSAIPLNTREFFSSLATKAKTNWGMATYEQDWLDAIITKSSYLTNSTGRIATYMTEQALGLADAGVTIGYGSANPFHLLQALDIPSATFVFASNNPTDMETVEQNFHVSRSAILSHEVGMVAMKDAWWSSSQENIDNPNPLYNYTNGWPNSAMHAAIATLTNGPVGPGDAINASNATLLKRTCRADGLLLRPTRPCLAVDVSLEPGFNGELCDATVDVGGSRWHYVLSAALAEDIKITTDLLDTINDDELFYVTDAQNEVSGGFLSDKHIVAPKDVNATKIGAEHQFNLFRISPELKGAKGSYFLLGELEKFVSVSTQRFTEVEVGGDSRLKVLLSGVEEEIVEIGVGFMGRDGEVEIAVVGCEFGGETTATITCMGTSCECI